MRVFEAHMPDVVCDYFRTLLSQVAGYGETNETLYNRFGIVDFFETPNDLADLRERIDAEQVIDDRDKIEYGDFQTNRDLAGRVAEKIGHEFSPQTVIEPTCGKGHFLLASLQHFPDLRQLIGIEIYKPYIWETKFNLVDYYLSQEKENKPDIRLYHSSVFDFDFSDIEPEGDLLILGNPPWVTNAKLGQLQSTNLPEKSNFKNLNGWDAITGKGNFDIGEYITLMMFNAFQDAIGRFAFLVKNTVIKNVLFDQKAKQYNIGDLRRYGINSKAEFNVAVEASLFTCAFGAEPAFDCAEYSTIDSPEPFNHFGWTEGKFVSSIERYNNARDIDGQSPFVWRSGVKHDCSSVMELERINGHFVNAKKQEVHLEEDIVYGLLKSSDLKKPLINTARKQTIVTQRKVGQETGYIQGQLPLTYAYLSDNRESLDKRGSSIYKDKPEFSIFGIGEYSFKPYKVAISGLYKKYDFNLVLPENGKPLMVDDTCYFLGFDRMDHAVYTYLLLNSEPAKDLLKAISFYDAKRIFTKDVLMRLDLGKLAESMSQAELTAQLQAFNRENAQDITLEQWDGYLQSMTPAVKTEQGNLFSTPNPAPVV